MTNMARRVTAIVVPGLAWATHFIAVYALISAACPPRAMIGYSHLVATVAAVTLAALAACLWSVVSGWGKTDNDLGGAAFWSGLIFALAIFADAAILFFFQGCGG
ncbi:hypothetical protein [Stappia stellulata]|uniref:hypothetical protein n=1 Tax=Stappia stellulata TaxID=71235 RepID=UPI0003FE6498|nr:hypothetical protein [Stappia stellulata]